MTDYDVQAGRAMPDPQRSAEQDAADADDLQGGVAGLSTMLSANLNMADLLEQVSSFAVDAIPGVDGAGVVLLRGEAAAGETTALEAWGAGPEFVDEIDRIQYELVHEGPCLTCIETHRPAVSGSLGSDTRWGRFGGRVARLGVHSALSLPLLLREDQVVGAINAYAMDRDVFTEQSVRIGERFARTAAVAVHNAQLLDAVSKQAAQLQAALGSRAVIDQAIGIVRSRVGGGADEAFDRLRRISQAENVKLAVVAQRMVDEAVRRAHARHVDSEVPGRG